MPSLMLFSIMKQELMLYFSHQSLIQTNQAQARLFIQPLVLRMFKVAEQQLVCAKAKDLIRIPQTMIIALELQLVFKLAFAQEVPSKQVDFNEERTLDAHQQEKSSFMAFRLQVYKFLQILLVSLHFSVCCIKTLQSLDHHSIQEGN